MNDIISKLDAANKKCAKWELNRVKKAKNECKLLDALLGELENMEGFNEQDIDNLCDDDKRIICQSYLFCAVRHELTMERLRGRIQKNNEDLRIGFEMISKAMKIAEYFKGKRRDYLLYYRCCLRMGDYYCYTLQNENARKMYQTVKDDANKYGDYNPYCMEVRKGLQRCWFYDKTGIYCDYYFLHEDHAPKMIMTCNIL